MRALWIAALAAGVLSGSVLAADTAPPVAADTPEKTPSGATFTLAKDWALTRHDKYVVATSSEGDTFFVIADIAAAKDAADAVVQAWALYRPDVHRKVQTMTARPGRDGWDERQVVQYETSPNEKAAVQAVAMRSGTKWVVDIVDGKEATVEKRGAALGLMIQSLRPAGYHRETFAGKTAHRFDAARIEALKNFVRTAMEQLGVPGAGVAIVDHGTVVYEGGIGVRELGKPEPVGAHTLFMIASNTKGMSTLLLARLVDEGKLRWDQKVTDVYPTFRLGSADTTSKVLMKNLVCACTGLPRKDFDWIFNTPRTTPATTTFDQLAATEPTSKFGEVFQYNNLMATAAGYIGGHIVHPDLELGAAYDSAMQSMIFDPLGMHETTFDMARALSGDYASPHADDIDGKPTVASMDLNYAVMPYRPAGGAWSSPHDMIKYVQDELSLGVLPSGKRFVSEKNLLERRKPNVPVAEDAFYGMGLETDNTWGVTVVHHGGSLGGYKSDWIAIPDAQVGAVLLTNADTGQLMLRPFMRRVLEILYDGKPEAADDAAAQAKRIKAELAEQRTHLVVPAAPDIVKGLAAHYTNPELGFIKISQDKSGLLMDFGSWNSHAATRKNDDGTFELWTIDPSVDGFEFVIGAKAGKRTLTVRDGQHEYEYVEG
ncbi:MAG TPA: serine hydrolase domain-containing protein [Rhizomicrobium sp.]|jgi:CubicO group peptidase (beta-lactamase class C family)|nr:serine hydrolase domain-containing protein [Rhizomicrobium sp.]